MQYWSIIITIFISQMCESSFGKLESAMLLDSR